MDVHEYNCMTKIKNLEYIKLIIQNTEPKNISTFMDIYATYMINNVVIGVHISLLYSGTNFQLKHISF